MRFLLKPPFLHKTGHKISCLMRNKKKKYRKERHSNQREPSYSSLKNFTLGNKCNILLILSSIWFSYLDEIHVLRLPSQIITLQWFSMLKLPPKIYPSFINFFTLVSSFFSSFIKKRVKFDFPRNFQKKGLILTKQSIIGWFQDPEKVTILSVSFHETGKRLAKKWPRNLQIRAIFWFLNIRSAIFNRP